MLVKQQMIGTELIDLQLVFESVQIFKDIIDADEIELNWASACEQWDKLSNDEQCKVADLLSDKAPDSGPRGRQYRSILKDYLGFVPE